MDKDVLFEKLAAIEHERWAHWQKYLHSLCKKTPDGELIIPANSVKHWEKQINTSYSDLSEREKDSDRQEVKRYWDLALVHLINTVEAAFLKVNHTIATDHDVFTKENAQAALHAINLMRDILIGVD
jgi:hypothetical protein